MNVGTKSLLFGAHQFLLHPLMVLLSWLVYYKQMPKFYQLCAIVTHDWGYWGSPNMDGEEGREHPEKAANIWRLSGKFGVKVIGEILGHSASYASKYRLPVSKLYKADKLSPIFISCYFYVFLGSLSGEILEYMEVSYGRKLYNVTTTDKIKWFCGTLKPFIERVYDE